MRFRNGKIGDIAILTRNGETVKIGMSKTP